MSKATQLKEAAVKNVIDMPDFAKKTMAEQLAWLDEQRALIVANSQKEFEEAVNYLMKTAKALGRSNVDVAKGVLTLLTPEERSSLFPTATATAAAPRKRAPNGSKPAKTMKSADSDGKVPEVGKTYQLNGESWTKATAVGAVKKPFMVAVQNGAKWADLEVKA